ncbi:MAG: flagellar biosynthesis protein FlgM [Lentisphaeria bacterium]|nr:flagellar biosynthesis protein FlgM [Lentisphaeria bacterium]
MIHRPSVWGYGQLLTFSGIDGKTDYEAGLCLRTAMEGYIFEVKNPAEDANAEIIYTGSLPDKIELTGDYFMFFSGGKISRGVLIDAHHLLLDGEFALKNQEYFDVRAKGERTLFCARGYLKEEYLDYDIDSVIAARAEFLERIELPSGLAESTSQCAAKACSQLKTQIYTPEGNISHFWSTPNRWPHKMMWLWDSVFHAAGMRHYRVDIAREMISAVFDMQQEDGFIPHCGDPSTVSAHTQAPILGLGIKLVDEIEHDTSWLAEVTPKLRKYILWIMKNRDTDGAGLVEWKIGTETTCRSGESGMDNSPRFDGAIQLDAPDFNAYLAGECEILAELLPDERDFWLGHYERICSLIRERLWSEEDGLFVDYDVVAQKRTNILSSAGFLPLYCKAATPEQAAIMVKHLKNPKTFGTPFRIPSISASNTHAYQKDMWRGPVWINVNYLIVLGLKRYGYDDLAREIVRDTIAEVEQNYLKYGTFFEFYDDRKEVSPLQLERKGKMPPGPFNFYHQVFHDYGWTATLYLDMINRKDLF